MPIDDLNRRISGKILELMGQKALTAYRVMKACGIPKMTFYRMMNSESPWKVEFLVKIAEYFNISLDQLILGPKQDEYGSHKRRTVLEEDYQLLLALKQFGIDDMGRLQEVLRPMKIVAERMAEYSHKRKGGRK